MSHEARMAAREENKERLLAEKPCECTLSDSLCKDHEKWFVYVDGREIVTCPCKVGGSEELEGSNFYRHSEKLGDALVKAVVSNMALRERIIELENALEGND